MGVNIDSHRIQLGRGAPDDLKKALDAAGLGSWASLAIFAAEEEEAKTGEKRNKASIGMKRKARSAEGLLLEPLESISRELASKLQSELLAAAEREWSMMPADERILKQALKILGADKMALAGGAPGENLAFKLKAGARGALSDLARVAIALESEASCAAIASGARKLGERSAKKGRSAVNIRSFAPAAASQGGEGKGSLRVGAPSDRSEDRKDDGQAAFKLEKKAESSAQKLLRDVAMSRDILSATRDWKERQDCWAESSRRLEEDELKIRIRCGRGNALTASTRPVKTGGATPIAGINAFKEHLLGRPDRRINQRGRNDARCAIVRRILRKQIDIGSMKQSASSSKESSAMLGEAQSLALPTQSAS